jgi:hypothetical protein
MKITNDEEYAAAVARMHVLWETATTADELVALSGDIVAYEAVRWSIDEPTPEAAAAFRREQEQGMANYYDVSIADVTNPDLIGFGHGDTPSGEKRICISLEGDAINTHLDESWTRVDWRALTEDCARHLYEMLHAHFQGAAAVAADGVTRG